MNEVCSICSSAGLQYLFSKPSKDHINYNIFQCKKCNIAQVSPLPSQEILDSYYSNEYFTSRTDRGYENYYSDETRKEIFRVWNLNLSDLGINPNLYPINNEPSNIIHNSVGKNLLSNNSSNPKMQSNDAIIQFASDKARSLDVGCAAGYFVDYMKSLGWQSMGIEIAPDPIKFAREKLKLDIVEGNFLEWDKQAKEKFEMITLWASIEHMRDPLAVLKKILSHLTEDGILILSTCRWGILSKILKKKWRFLNVPEHLFYFGLDEIIKLMHELGYKYHKSITYGSGMTMKKNPSKIFLKLKKFLDWFVKISNQGDMMALCFKKS